MKKFIFLLFLLLLASNCFAVDLGQDNVYHFGKYVGIGTTEPDSMLDVRGIVRSFKSIQSTSNQIIVDSIADLPVPINTTDLPITFDSGTNEVQHVYGAGVFADGQAIEFIGGSLPAEIALRTIYFAFNNDADSFNLSYTPPSIFISTVTFSNGSGNARVAGDMIMDDDANYSLNEAIYTPYDMIISTNNYIEFTSPLVYTKPLVYTGIGTLFNGDTIYALGLNRIAVSAPFGKLYDIDTVLGAISVTNSIFNSVYDMGTIKNAQYYVIDTFGVDIGFGHELIDMTSYGFVNFDILTTRNYSTDFFNVSGTCGTGTFQTMHANPLSNENIFNFDSALITTGVTGNGIVAGNPDRVFAAGSLDQTEINFNFSGNVGIPDSTVLFQLGIQDNLSTEVVIDTSDIPKKIDSGLFVTEFYERFLVYSTGTVVYTGLEDAIIDVFSISTMQPVTGVNIELGTYLAKTDVLKSSVTFTNATNLVNRNDHGISNDTSIRFVDSDGTLPTGLEVEQFHWVINANTNDFQVSASEGGAAETFSDDGSGDLYYSLGGIIHSSEGENIASNIRVGNFISSSLIEIETGDQIEVFCDNHDNDSNIIVKGIQFKGKI